jgi:hypothetical protein
VVEERQDVVASPGQGAAELGDLLQPGRYAAAYRVDQPGHGLFAAAAVGIGVGGDDLLVDQPGDPDGEVFLGVEHAAESVVLASREQLTTGAGDAANPIQRRSSTGEHCVAHEG